MAATSTLALTLALSALTDTQALTGNTRLYQCEQLLSVLSYSWDLRLISSHITYFNGIIPLYVNLIQYNIRSYNIKYLDPIIQL